MQRYRLRCECGTDIRVSKGQAGGEVTCGSCGRSLPVPMLREFGSFPSRSLMPVRPRLHASGRFARA